jgi:PhoPQ-activated pathogenicity-related protein
MVGAADDPRVKAIAPMVIDNLNLKAQMEHQMNSWGFYSEMIRAYTERGLQAQLKKGRGHDLAVMVDPYSYRKNFKVPTLIVKGSNDPYWTADALDQYWPELTQPKWILNVPNAGHTLGDGIMAVASIGAFAQSIAGDFPMPRQTWTFKNLGTAANLTVTSVKPKMSELILWKAESDSLDFRKSTYLPVEIVGKDKPKKDAWTVETALSGSKNTAIFGEMRYVTNGKAFSLSTPTEIFPKLK